MQCRLKALPNQRQGYLAECVPAYRAPGSAFRRATREYGKPSRSHVRLNEWAILSAASLRGAAGKKMWAVSLGARRRQSLSSAWRRADIRTGPKSPEVDEGTASVPSRRSRWRHVSMTSCGNSIPHSAVRSRELRTGGRSRQSAWTRPADVEPEWRSRELVRGWGPGTTVGLESSPPSY
jgi:hypothetical protein